MPNVNSQGIIAVSPEIINIIRGQQANVTITLHKDFVGTTNSTIITTAKFWQAYNHSL